MRKIVIPTDFSDNAFNALKYASELFKYEQSEFILLHAYAEELYNSSNGCNSRFFNELKAEIHESSTEHLENIRKDIIEISPNPKHTYKKLSAFGLLVDEVNDLVNKENADIAVMGTRGKTINSDKTFGSNTLQVIKYVQCPVLCIPEFFEFKSPEKILFPTNCMIPYQRRELKLVAEIARRFCAEIHILHISKFPVNLHRRNQNQEILKDAFYQIKLEFHNRDPFHKEDAINEVIHTCKMDFLVMVNSRQTYLESILSQSTVDKISLKPEIPFLVLQNFNRTS